MCASSILLAVTTPLPWLIARSMSAAGGLFAAHDLDDDVDLGVVDDGARGGGQRGRVALGDARLAQVAHQDATHLQRRADPLAQVARLVAQQPQARRRPRCRSRADQAEWARDASTGGARARALEKEPWGCSWARSFLAEERKVKGATHDRATSAAAIVAGGCEKSLPSQAQSCMGSVNGAFDRWLA